MEIHYIEMGKSPSFVHQIILNYQESESESESGNDSSASMGSGRGRGRPKKKHGSTGSVSGNESTSSARSRGRPPKRIGTAGPGRGHKKLTAVTGAFFTTLFYYCLLVHDTGSAIIAAAEDDHFSEARNKDQDYMFFGNLFTFSFSQLLLVADSQNTTLTASDMDSLRMPPPLRRSTRSRRSSSVSSAGSSPVRKPIRPMTNMCSISHLGYGCGAKSAGHLPPYYNSLDPVFFCFFNKSIFFTLEQHWY